MKFRLTTILWFFALFASAMAAFGGAGVIPAGGLSIYWSGVFYHRKYTAWQWLVLLGFVLFAIALLMSVVQQARVDSRKNYYLNNLRQLGLSLHNYHDQHGQFPAAYSLDTSGNRLHSWRYYVLPYLELEDLYQQIVRDDAWNSPNNRPHTNTPISLMQCPNRHARQKQSCTDYFAIVGPQTMWPSKRGRNFSKVLDGTSQTLLLIEAVGRNIGWAEPKDLTVEEAITLLTTPSRPDSGDGHWVERGFFYKPSVARRVLFADGWARAISTQLSKETALALLTANASEQIDWTELDNYGDPQLNYARIYSLSLFVLLSLLPIIKLRQKQNISPKPLGNHQETLSE